jgi:hypothetical protein
LTTSRKTKRRGRPVHARSLSHGSINAHCSSVRSVGYARRVLAVGIGSCTSFRLAAGGRTISARYLFSMLLISNAL